MEVARVGMIDSTLSGWDKAARYWSRGTTESDETPVDPVVRSLLDRRELLLAEIATLEAEIERRAVASRPRSAEISGLRSRTDVWVVRWYRRPLRVAVVVFVTIVASASVAVLLHEETAPGIPLAQVETIVTPEIEAAMGVGGRVASTTTVMQP